MTSSLKSDPSSFWRFVNSKKNTNSEPKLLQLGDKSTVDKGEQAELFATFFKSNFASHASQIHMHTQNTFQTKSNFNQLVLDEFFVFDELLKINTKKGIGPDGIHPLLLKNCAAILCHPLSDIFNESLVTGIFPDKWKLSSVNPIFKKGSRSNIENYRCISKLLTIVKFFEYLISLKLKEMVADKISPQQHERPLNIF